MKSVFFLSLISLTSLAWSVATPSAKDWKVVAESTGTCKEKLQVLAKEGEKFVYVTNGQAKTKLASEDGSAFSEQNAKPIVFTNNADKSLNESSEKFTFTQPAMVDGNPAKLHVSQNGVKDNCKMNLK